MTLLWRNPAARFVRARLKKNGLKLSAEAVPIRGQVQRLIRLGRPGQTSLSRVQFIVGDKPLALTCAATPLTLAGGETGLLLLGEEKVDKDVREAAADLAPDGMTEGLLPAGSDYLLLVDGAVRAGSAGALASEAPRIAHDGLPQAGATIDVLKAGPKDQVLVIYHAAEDGTAAASPAPVMAAPVEPELPMGLTPAPEAETAPADAAADNWAATGAAAEAMSGAPGGALSSLFDRLADDAQLYSGLSAADEVFAGPPPELPAPVSAAELAATETFAPIDRVSEARAEEGETDDEYELDLADMPEMMLPVSPEAEEAPAEVPVVAAPVPEDDLIATVIAFADEDAAPQADDTEPPAPTIRDDEAQRTHWMITGRGFRPLAPEATATFLGAAEAGASEEPGAAPVEAGPGETVGDAADAASVERVTRYNFEELGRILTDRVAGEARGEPAAPAARNADAVVSLTAETLILNRLPLAILVFRDQQVLFANRALTDLLAYESVESLRAGGIAGIFPSEAVAAGPVNQLVRRDGTLLPVTARLQSVTWQGRTALMLSASTVEPLRGHEGAVRAFAALAAETQGDGFILADRAGNITDASPTAALALGRDTAADLLGKPLAVVIAADDLDALRALLDKPARFAETARPSATLRAESGAAKLTLFAEGQAGVVSGYFGLVRRHAPTSQAAPRVAASDDGEGAAMLARLSRGIRRPLNTIIGFADLIRSADTATTPTDRLMEYAGDIRTAGLEIAVLTDEIDDYTQLRDAETPHRLAEIDLNALLENCVIRIRGQAGAARVLVRTAISERLPPIRADRTSLGQAILNLLASAIDMTPVGESVILSAQYDDDGNIAVHVRDGGMHANDLADRFVVFRDGTDKQGEVLEPVRSTMGLALTRSLLAANACTLSIDPTAGVGTLFTLTIPAGLIVRREA